jgi:hypothetical protein
MIEHDNCGAQLWVEFREDGGTLVRVYVCDDKEVTDCPVCGAPLPTDVLQPDPDDEEAPLWDHSDPDSPPASPDEDTTPDD